MALSSCKNSANVDLIFNFVDETDVTTARLLRNSLVDEAMSPASVDSAYSSSPPSPPLHYNQDSSYSSRAQDNINGEFL